MFDGNATPNDGDANGDGDVDGNDFLIWQAGFSPGGDGGASSAVPEPAAAVLGLLVAGLAAIARRRNG